MLAAPYRLEPVRHQDFESLLALRIRALRPSLERLGRFDPDRARERFQASFMSPCMWHISTPQGLRIGLVTLRPTHDALQLDHLYIEPARQSQGVGQWVMHWAKAQADAQQLPLQLEVLKRGGALRFYARHGFSTHVEGEWDFTLRREPTTAPKAVVSALWTHFQARDWVAARALLHDDLRAHWWTSAERFDGAAGFMEANAGYPEGWAICPLHIAQQDDGRVLTIVRVDHLPHRFYATSLFTVVDGQIQRIDECWAQAEEPPAWRLEQRLPGWSRFDALKAAA
jgi:GNAT superfamily N-acetyltransferase